MASSFSAIIEWPNAPLTDSLVRNALKSLEITHVASPHEPGPLLQWSTYDNIDHESVLTRPNHVLSSSYTFRKALIRKHFLSRVIHSYQTKYPKSVLKDASPVTYEVELSFADELDEMWTDELWELGASLDSADSDSWWILKPGMADRGMGIRIFNSKEQLQQIFEGFESDDESDGEGEHIGAPNNTSIVTSQLRHFVVQKYLTDPLLLDPYEVSLDNVPKTTSLEGHKFHLRVYCVAKGALKLYFYDRILALFASVPYVSPAVELDASRDSSTTIDLRPHLTNTSLQVHRGEEGVRLFDELVGCHILSGSDSDKRLFTSDDLRIIKDQIAHVLAETFKAALENPIHFQALPNAFELYGVDFLVSHLPSNTGTPFQVKLLEINAEPAIELTGPRLTWILEDLFKTIANVCVRPFFVPETEESWPVGESRHHFVKCLDVSVRSWDT